MSTERLPRLLALVPYLLARPGVRLTEAAADFDISEAQLRKDLELLWVCGLPGYGPGDLIDLSFEGDTVTVTYDAGMSRPLRLTPDEALALSVALRTLADVPGLASRDAVQRAAAKVETAAGSAAAPPGAVAVRVEATEGVLAVVHDALAGRRALHLRYYTATRDASTERDVDPMRVLLVEGRSYLEAWCRAAEGVRLFRLDRVQDIQVLDQPSRPPPDATPRDISAGVFRPSAEHLLVTLALSPAAAWLAEYYPCESVTDLPDGELQVTMRVADPRWIRHLVASAGPAATVLAPGWLADDIRTEAARALAAYAQPV